MKIRGLKGNDVFKMSRILKKMEIKPKVTDEKGKTKTQEQLGAELVVTVVENLHLAQDEVNDFLGGLVGLSGEEFGELEFGQILDVIKQFKEMPGIENFLKLAGQLTK